MIENLINFLIEIEYDTMVKIKCHSKASEYYKEWNTKLSLPVILLSTFTGSTIFSVNSSNNYIQYITSGFGITIAVLSSIDKYFNFSKLSEFHSNISKLYESLQRDIKFFIKENTISENNKDCEENIKEFIREIHNKIEQIENENYGSIPNHIYEEIKNKENKTYFIKNKLLIYEKTTNSERIKNSSNTEKLPNLKRQNSFNNLIIKKNKNVKDTTKNMKSLNIISLEDNSIHSLLLKKILSEHYNISCFTNIELFYEDLKKYRYDIIILDYILKNKNGLEIAKKLKENNIKSVIICVTSYDDIYNDENNKYIDFIYKKPIIKKELLKFIKNIKNHSTMIVPDELTSV